MLLCGLCSMPCNQGSLPHQSDEISKNPFVEMLISWPASKITAAPQIRVCVHGYRCAGGYRVRKWKMNTQTQEKTFTKMPPQSHSLCLKNVC